jgi:hypothetical protein
MVPWPVALLAAFYAVIATLSTGRVWRILSGASDRPLLWPLLWLLLAAATMCGLVLLKAWARRLAVWGFGALALFTLASAGALAGAGRPGAALLVAFSAGLYVLGMRYLGRPAIKAFFQREN